MGVAWLQTCPQTDLRWKKTEALYRTVPYVSRGFVRRTCKSTSQVRQALVVRQFLQRKFENLSPQKSTKTEPSSNSGEEGWYLMQYCFRVTMIKISCPANWYWLTSVRRVAWGRFPGQRFQCGMANTYEWTDKIQLTTVHSVASENLSKNIARTNGVGCRTSRRRSRRSEKTALLLVSLQKYLKYSR